MADYVATVSWTVPGAFRVSYYRIRLTGPTSFEYIYAANSTSPTSVTVTLNQGSYYEYLTVSAHENTVCGPTLEQPHAGQSPIKYVTG